MQSASTIQVPTACGQESQGSSLKGLTAVLVDDDRLTRETLKGMLHRLGLSRVEEAGHGQEAVEILERIPIDVVLTDIHMPRMDGLELLREVKRRWPGVPVVVITGYPTIETAVDAMRRGASDLIVKPFRMEQIELSLQRAARERMLLVENSLLSKELAQKKEIERLNRRLHRKLMELSKLYAISESIQPGHLEGEDLFERIVTLASQITEARRACVMLLDEETNRLVMKAACGEKKGDCQEVCTRLGEGIAGRVALLGEPLLVGELPSGDLGGTGGCHTGSMISVPLRIRGEVFGVINVADKSSGKGFRKEDLALLVALAQKAALAIENQALYEGIYTTLTDTLLSLVSTIEARDPYTKDHSQRVTNLAVRIAQKMGMSQDETDMLRFAGYLHDIGKIGIRDSILMKPGNLTPEETSIIRTHPIIGERIVKPLGLLPMERSVIRHHHERWDGSGYPDGLRGEEIPLAARVLAVADVFDAMTSDRVYRRGMPAQEALREIQRAAGSQFDREVVSAFAMTQKEDQPGSPTPRAQLGSPPLQAPSRVLTQHS